MDNSQSVEKRTAHHSCSSHLVLSLLILHFPSYGFHSLTTYLFAAQPLHNGATLLLRTQTHIVNIGLSAIVSPDRPKAGVGKLWPAGQTQPTTMLHPARECIQELCIKKIQHIESSRV